LTGPLNDVSATSVVAMPDTFCATAVLIASTIWPTLLVCDPVH
jgi:hypothetical protein